MMSEHDNYINLTRAHLKKYNQYKAAIENLNEDIEAMQSDIKNDVAAPVASYGTNAGGVVRELNAVESATEKHLSLSAKIQENKRCIEAYERILRKIDRAIGELKPDDQFLIKGHFIDRRKWKDLSAEKFYTEKWARERSRKAVKAIAFMMFGDMALIAKK